MNYKFVEVKKEIKHEGGYLVIESDDGRPNDLLFWAPMMFEKGRKYSKFYPQNTVLGCTNVNTGFLNEGYRMTDKQLKRLNDIGFEIDSHGRYHAGMGLYPVVESVQAGSSTVDVIASERIKVFSETGYEYLIREGGNSEVIRVETQNGDSHTRGTITLMTPLQNSYTENARIELTDESRKSELQGAISDLTALGINTSHYVYPYHSGSDTAQHFNPHAVSEVGKIYKSARGTSDHNGLNNRNQSDFDIYRLNARLLNDALTKEKVNESLLKAKNDNSVFILYGHGESPRAKRFSVLEYAIDRALELGIKIISREDAYRVLSD